MSEAQAEAKAWRDQREAMWLKMRGKKMGFTRKKMRAALGMTAGECFTIGRSRVSTVRR